MASADVLYTARFPGPELLIRDRDCVIECPVYRDGALVAPAAGGTVTVYRPDGTKLVDAQTITVSGSIAQYTITSATLSGETLGEGWRVEWALTLSSAARTFRRAAAVCRRRLWPVVTDADLFRRHSELNDSDMYPSGQTSWQPQLDEAWVEILGMLSEAGTLPYLIMEPSAFRRVHVYKALEIIYRDLNTSQPGGGHLDVSDGYEERFTAAWSAMAFRYDNDHDGEPDDLARKRGASAIVMLC